jgi:hypothetical protein
MHDSMAFIKYGAVISGGIIFFYAMNYIIERFGRHYVENEPFLEF